MTPEDMAALHAAAFTHPRPWSAAEIAGLLDSFGCFTVTVGTGFALGRAIAGEAELLTIAVHPDHRRAGEGRRLLTAFEAEARARDAERAFLEVAADNAPAHALYRSADYHEIGRRPGYYQRPDGQRIEAMILEKQLHTPVLP